MNKYITVVGLEIHAELLTKTKLFCGCPNAFGGDENEYVCPGCLGLPGTMPELNRAAVDLAIKGGLALGCKISELTSWDRKNYFYADLPNGYQITQMFAPICVGGGVAINSMVGAVECSTGAVSGQSVNGDSERNTDCQNIGARFIRLNHIHLEEDAGKLVHDTRRNISRIDFNRGGVPLIEIVTEPDMRSAEEAVAFVEKVRLALLYAGVCDGKLEQGHMRVDANVSVMPEGADKFGTRIEVKNLNSFYSIARAINYEVSRQIRVIETGGALRQETRRFIDGSGETAAMREKENAQDYRYFPDCEIPPLMIPKEYVEGLRASLPEPPDARRARYAGVHQMSESDADTILAQKTVSDFYDEMIALGAEPKDALGVVRGEVLRRMGGRRANTGATVDSGGAVNPGGAVNLDADGEYNDADVSGIAEGAGNTGSNTDAERIAISAKDAVELLRLRAAGKITVTNMKKAIGIMMSGGGESLDDVIRANDMLVREDPDLLATVVREALAANPRAVAQYKAGEFKTLGFLIGQCNKTLKGSVQPGTLQDELRAQLDAL